MYSEMSDRAVLARCSSSVFIGAVGQATWVPLRVFGWISANEWCLTSVISHSSVEAAWPEALKQTLECVYTLLTSSVWLIIWALTVSLEGWAILSTVLRSAVIGSNKSFAGLLKPGSEAQGGNVTTNYAVLSGALLLKVRIWWWKLSNETLQNFKSDHWSLCPSAAHLVWVVQDFKLI